MSDAGFRDGLLPLTQLRELNLVNVGKLTDRGVASLVASWGRLERLSLSNCGLLTNAALQALSRLPVLRVLVVTDNVLFSAKSSVPLPSTVQLSARECPGLTGIQVYSPHSTLRT